MKKLLAFILVLTLASSAKAVSIYEIISNSCDNATEFCRFSFRVREKSVALYTSYWIFGWGVNNSIYYGYRPRYAIYNLALYPSDRLVANKTPVTLVLADNAYKRETSPEDLFAFWISLDDGQFYDLSWNPVSPDQIRPVVRNWNKSLSTVGFDGWQLPPPKKAGHYVLVVGTRPPGYDDTLGEDWLHVDWDNVVFYSIRAVPDFDENWDYFQEALERVHSVEDLYEEIRRADETFPSKGAEIIRECEGDPDCYSNRCEKECLSFIIPSNWNWNNPDIGVNCVSIAIFLSEIILHKGNEIGIPPDHMWFVNVRFPTDGHVFLIVWKEDEDMFYALDETPGWKIAKGHTLWEAIEAAEKSKERFLGSLEESQWSIAPSYLWWKALGSEFYFSKAKAVYNGQYVEFEWISSESTYGSVWYPLSYIPLTPDQMKQITGEDLMRLTGRR